ncbi:hypothetical protein [Streptomyces sp. BH105]|uniref:hypothetical protein n=1 Tax=Streptomyces sp. BH105 TaxID=3410408 RepID=UPI003CF665C8
MGMESLSVDQRADNGARLLDQVGPKDWRERVEAYLLDIDHGYFCVLGQVYAEEGNEQGYEYALSHLDFLDSGDALEFFGFYGLGDEDGTKLTASWRALLRNERKPAEPPFVTDEADLAEDQCGNQTAYGLPGMRFCAFPKGQDSQYCPACAEDLRAQYGRRM